MKNNATRMSVRTQAGTLYMTRLALLIAIIFLMAFTPLGYLRTPGLSITFLTVPVAVGAVTLGPSGGAACGMAFGITSLIQCLGGGGMGAVLLGINPAGMAFTCIVPRVLEGWISGLIFRAVRRISENRACMAASLACPFLNTLLFMTSLVLFFYPTEYVRSLAGGMGTENPFAFAAAFVGVQGVIEACVCFVAAGAVSRAVLPAFRRA
ncbi:MAG: ECF transporter S component [Lachnospiraceae bacterium]|jgi:uncharacterized membrane protein|nr:ECF transporter S component [Lachnospiraceae bacterium]